MKVMENIKPLKILYISSRSDMGGGPKHLLQLLKHFSQSKSQFSIFLASPEDKPFGDQFKKHAQCFIKIPHRHFSFMSYFKLLSLCKENSIDIIHSHGRGAGTYSRLLALFGFKIIHTFHGVHNDLSLLGRLKLQIDRLLSMLTDQFICVSESEKQKALLFKVANVNKIRVIENGIDFHLSGPISSLDLRKEHSIPSEVKLWGTLSRLGHEKGLDLFLKTIIKTSRLKNIFFFVAGSGDQRENLQSLLNSHHIKNVKLIGEIQNPLSFLKGLDGYFSYSRGEGLPLSVLEALSCNLPCLLSNVTGHDQFKNKVDLFDLHSPEDFIQKIQSPLKPDYSKLISYYSEDRMIERIKKTYFKQR